MLYHNPNSRGRRNVLRIVGVLVVLAVIASVANFLRTTTSDAVSNVKPQIETMQGIRQTAQDSITFAQSMDDPNQFATHIETVQRYIDDYDRLADAKQIKYLLSDNPQERIIGLLYRNQQRTIIDNMRVAAHNLDKQTKELLSAVDAAMSDDFSQHAGQWLLQVDDPTQVNELIDRYGKQRNYASMRELLTDLQSLHKLREDVKQQVSDAVGKLHDAEATAAAIAVPERNGDLDPAMVHARHKRGIDDGRADRADRGIQLRRPGGRESKRIRGGVLLPDARPHATGCRAYPHHAPELDADRAKPLAGGYGQA